DVILQTLVKLVVGLAVTAEPYRILDQDWWFGDRGCSVAIIARVLLRTHAPSLLQSCVGFVVISSTDVVVVVCYVSPSRGLSSCEWYLDEPGGFLSEQMARPVPVLGDFKAHYVA
ncbi:PREDICTED: uncharacterized protein LOC108554559, partial [Eufriesea mexicana]|uniref:uncharacterized protein LOC108554559 n=1 Tax=Eufriesea mexicana TaxID=516756 RepID=UPI00083C8976